MLNHLSTFLTRRMLMVLLVGLAACSTTGCVSPLHDDLVAIVQLNHGRNVIILDTFGLAIDTLEAQANETFNYHRERLRSAVIDQLREGHGYKDKNGTLRLGSDLDGQAVGIAYTDFEHVLDQIQEAERTLNEKQLEWSEFVDKMRLMIAQAKAADNVALSDAKQIKEALESAQQSLDYATHTVGVLVGAAVGQCMP